MVEYNKVNVKLSDSQLKKLKSKVKSQTRTSLTMNIKMFEGNNLPHELLLTTRQKTKLRKAFEINMSTDIKLPKTQISIIMQLGGSLGSLVKVAVSPAKNILAPLGITAAASAIEAGIQKKIYGSGTTTLIISNEKTNEIMNFVQYFIERHY